VPTIDFITALGRVLYDGAMRDAFVRDAGAFMESINLRESDRAAFLRLSPADLEIQARILLRKRFELVRRISPRTCQTLGPSAWNHFVVSCRSGSSRETEGAAQDANQFFAHLVRVQPASIYEAELNRSRFSNAQRRAAVHLIKRSENQWLPAIQLLIRLRPQGWREWQIYAGI